MKALHIGNKMYFEGKYKNMPNLQNISINIEIEASNFNLWNITNYEIKYISKGSSEHIAIDHEGT